MRCAALAGAVLAGAFVGSGSCYAAEQAAQPKGLKDLAWLVGKWQSEVVTDDGQKLQGEIVYSWRVENKAFLANMSLSLEGKRVFEHIGLWGWDQQDEHIAAYGFNSDGRSFKGVIGAEEGKVLIRGVKGKLIWTFEQKDKDTFTIKHVDKKESDVWKRVKGDAKAP